MKLKLTKTLVSKILKNVDAGLSSGLGKRKPGQMCVEAAICYSLGLPHGDDPGCVSNAVRSLKIALNDSVWSSKMARARGMRRLAIAQLGTKENFDEIEFAIRVALLQYTESTFVAWANDWLSGKDRSRAAAYAAWAASAAAYAADAAAYAAWAAARLAADAARLAADAAANAADAAANAADAAWAAADAAAADAAANAAYAAWADAAASAAYAAWAAARATARLAADAAAYAAAYAAARDKALAGFAEQVVQVLITMKVPAVKYLPPL